MKTILIAIRRRHWNNIKARRKTLELRRTFPRDGAPFKVLCCVTGTAGEVVGEFVCSDIINLEGVAAGKIAARACLKPEEVRAYRERGNMYGWKIGPRTMIDYAANGGTKHISDYGLDRVPQSWCYVKDSEGMDNGI